MQHKINNQGKSRQKVVLIDDPRGLPGASFFTLIAISFHYVILSYLFLSGRYYNETRAPTFLFIIPSFVVTGSTVIGLLCYLLQNHSLVRKICEPSTGLPIAILGTVGLASYCFVVYGTLNRDFFQGYLLLGICILILIYFLLVRRRLVFAGVAFVESARAVSQIKIMWFRTLIFSVVLLAYICTWSVLYIQLISVPSSISQSSTSKLDNSTEPTYVPIPHWVSLVNSEIPVSKPGLRTAGKVFLVYNLLVVSQAVKVSLWMSISTVPSDLIECIRTGSKLRVQPLSELKYRMWQSLPSIILAGHLLFISQFIESAAEGLRRYRPRRAGFAYNVGSLLLFITRPLVSRVSVYGICRMNRTGRNIVHCSREAAATLSRCGLHDAVNGDLLCGARMCGCLLLACSGSVVASTLVTIFRFPPTLSHEVALLAFLAVFLAGNWGLECAEVWSSALALGFADAPDAIYVAAPRLALGLHATIFGCPRLSPHEAARRVHASRCRAQLARALAAWREASLPAAHMDAPGMLAEEGAGTLPADSGSEQELETSSAAPESGVAMAAEDVLGDGPAGWPEEAEARKDSGSVEESRRA